MNFYGHRYKIARVGTFYVAVIRGESCFEKNAFKVTENPHPPTKTRLPVKEYLGKYSKYRKKTFFFVLKLFIRLILFHGKLSFDNLTYFKLYGTLKVRKMCLLRLATTPTEDLQYVDSGLGSQAGVHCSYVSV